jgi:hypothetical protein
VDHQTDGSATRIRKCKDKFRFTVIEIKSKNIHMEREQKNSTQCMWKYKTQLTVTKMWASEATRFVATLTECRQR